MRWTIVANNAVVFGPSPWDAFAFSQFLQSLGMSVSCATLEPQAAIVFPSCSIVPVTESATQPTAGQKVTNESLTVDGYTVTSILTLADKTADELNPPDTPAVVARKQYENEYLEATRALMQLANEPFQEGTWPKLSDADFKRVGLQACTNSPGPGGFLMTSLEYTLRTLKYDFQWPWSQIEHRS